MVNVGVLLLAAALIPYVNYAPTPQAATVKALAGDSFHPGHAVVVRTNIAGRFATVLTRGGVLESEPAHEAVLLEKFSFGWQPLTLVENTCDIASYGMPQRDARILSTGMKHGDVVVHGFATVEPCKPPRGNIGPADDVDAVRKQMVHAMSPFVQIDGNYAVAVFGPPGGGQRFFKKTNGAWHSVTGGGGVDGTRDLQAHGIPNSSICAFHIMDAKCEGRRLISIVPQ